MLISLDEARAELPKLGEVRWECPVVAETQAHLSTKPQRCVVVDVRPAHLWYTVQFDNGFRESYKVPRGRSGSGGGRYGEN